MAKLDTERLIHDIARLRRAELDGAPDDVGEVREDLERAVGQTVSRALAARILGITQGALDRHIANGAIPVVLTLKGRKEVPLFELIRLVLDLEDTKRAGVLHHALAATLRTRRERARSIDRDTVLPSKIGSIEGHRAAELRGLAFHRAVAARLDRQLVLDARRRLERWRDDGHIDERRAQEWEQVLALPIEELRRAITADDPRGRDLRQSSPFAGALPHEDRQRVLELVAEAL